MYVVSQISHIVQIPGTFHLPGAVFPEVVIVRYVAFLCVVDRFHVFLALSLAEGHIEWLAEALIPDFLIIDRVAVPKQERPFDIVTVDVALFEKMSY